jgi:hypothetical protein
MLIVKNLYIELRMRYTPCSGLVDNLAEDHAHWWASVLAVLNPWLINQGIYLVYSHFGMSSL